MSQSCSSLISRSFVFLSFVFVLGCGSSGSSSVDEPEEVVVDPVISEVYTDIFHYHPSFFLKWSHYSSRVVKLEMVCETGVDEGTLQLLARGIG